MNANSAQAEAVLGEALLGEIPVVILLFRRSHPESWNILFASGAVIAITGTTRQKAVQPGWIQSHLSADDVGRLYSGLGKAASDGHASALFRFRRSDGRFCLIHAKLRRFCNASGQAGVAAVWSDVTAERRDTARIAQAAQLVELGEMAAGLAHEINRPLASIMMSAENATRQLRKLPGDYAGILDKLEKITQLAHQGAGLGRHVQNFGRHDSGQPGPIILASLIADLLVLAQARLRAANVMVVHHIPDNLPHLWAQPIPLQQVLINLLSNACDAYAAAMPDIPAQDRTITISARAQNNIVTLRVTDRAGGVPEQYLPNLFETYFSTKPANHGIGLGLPISAAIVQELGGQLSVINEAGGAMFALDLPTARA